MEGAGRRAAGRGDRAHEHHEQLEGPRHLPAAEVAGRGVAPDVGRQRRARATDRARDLDDRRRGHPALVLGELGGVAGVEVPERLLEGLEAHRLARPCLAEVLLPVHPAAHEGAVVVPLADQDARHREQQRRLGARPGREPPVGHRRGVRQPRVDDADLGSALLGLDDPLGVGVEVVAGLEV